VQVYVSNPTFTSSNLNKLQLIVIRKPCPTLQLGTGGILFDTPINYFAQSHSVVNLKRGIAHRAPGFTLPVFDTLIRAQNGQVKYSWLSDNSSLKN